MKFDIDLNEFENTEWGLRVIPFSQVLLFLVYEFDIKSSYDIKLPETLIATILNELDVKNYGLANNIHERTQISEVKLILFRFLGKFESFNNSQPSKDVV